jgi:hypothetical protein
MQRLAHNRWQAGEIPEGMDLKGAANRVKYSEKRPLI